MERKKAFLINFFYWSIVGVCIYAVFHYLLPVLLPFVAAYGVAYLLDKPVRLLGGESKWKRTAVSLFLSLAFFMILGGIVLWCGIWICSGIRQLVSFFPVIFQDFVVPVLEEGFTWAGEWLSLAAPSGLKFLDISFDSILEAFKEGIVFFSNIIFPAAAGLATGIPGIFMNLVIMIIATIFLTMDFQQVSQFLLRQIPERQKAFLFEAKGYFGKTMLKCLLSYVLIFFITFLEIWAGLALLRVPYAGMIAMVVAVLDILPVLGTGSVLIPWGILAAVNGNWKMAVGILVLYLVITIIRNILEPKLVGQQVGLHPVLTLAGMLLGLQFAGLMGMFGVPLLLAFVKHLNDKGMIHWIR